MKLNPPKTKELRACFSSQPVAFSPIVIDGQEVDIVTHAKLLGVVISNDLKWNLNVDYICKKAAKRLYALRLLKRSAIPSATLVSVYRTCIRPILEYACEVWHHSLPKYLAEQIKTIQRRALIIIFPDTCCELAREKANLQTLYQRRSSLYNCLFRRMSQPSHKLNCLFPKYRSTNYNLRKQNTLFLPKFRTSRYGLSFLPSAIRYFNNSI